MGSVLYLAAHPDDENTRLISWLANHKHVRTAYLSLTRGDGGQNLIGTEKGDALGVLRTQELMEARKIDGGSQFFTRAVDFGYSKSVDETLEIWDRDKVLADVVRIVRYFKPDMIITRFPTGNYGGHGHHTASAVLAEEAFDLAADPNSYPEQLEGADALNVWQVERLYFNSSSWWDKELPEKAKNSDDYVTVDIGAYNATLGRSYSEIAGESRSQHKSQGFGAARPRGEQIEYLQHIKGSKATDNDLFSGIKMGWDRMEGAEEIAELMQEAEEEFKAALPSKTARELLLALEQLNSLPNSHWKKVKSQQMQACILACYGIWLEAMVEKATIPTNEAITIQASALDRFPGPVELRSIEYPGGIKEVGQALEHNKALELELKTFAPLEKTQPYWLKHPHQGVYTLDHESEVHFPVSPPAMEVTFVLSINDLEIRHTVPVQYRWVDRVHGELYREMVVTPQASVALNQNVYFSVNKDTLEVNVTCMDLMDGSSGKVRLKLPQGWHSLPAEHEVQLAREEKRNFTFRVIPGELGVEGQMEAIYLMEGELIAHTMETVDHEHIQPQVFFRPAMAKLLSMELEKKGDRIAYVMGSGDEVPTGLEAMGYHVDLLTPADLNTQPLHVYDALITGIRAWNTEKELEHAVSTLNQYVAQGGNLIIQYNTNRGLDPDKMGPLRFKLGRGRVTDEAASAKFLQPDHDIFNTPNKIEQKDMEGWVQERGLYFAEEWDNAFTPLIAWNDPNEEPLEGALLVGEHGEGHVVYTGISFFRQLPAGVPGAYRLLANIISFGQ